VPGWPWGADERSTGDVAVLRSLQFLEENDNRLQRFFEKFDASGSRSHQFSGAISASLPWASSKTAARMRYTFASGDVTHRSNSTPHAHATVSR
jgi:hypothetical protein